MGSAQGAAGRGRGRTEVEERGLADVGQADDGSLELHGQPGRVKGPGGDFGVEEPSTGAKQCGGKCQHVWQDEGEDERAREKGESWVYHATS